MNRQNFEVWSHVIGGQTDKVKKDWIYKNTIYETLGNVLTKDFWSKMVFTAEYIIRSYPNWPPGYVDTSIFVPNDRLNNHELACTYSKKSDLILQNDVEIQFG